MRSGFVPPASSASGAGQVIDEQAWRDIERLAGAAGQRVGGGLVHTGGGTPVYVVVVVADRLPPVSLIRAHYRLTGREAEVALLLARRLSGAEIATQLGVTIHTARRHTEQVLLKLGVRDRLSVRAALERLGHPAAA